MSSLCHEAATTLPDADAVAKEIRPSALTPTECCSARAQMSARAHMAGHEFERSEALRGNTAHDQISGRLISGSRNFDDVLADQRGFIQEAVGARDRIVRQFPHAEERVETKLPPPDGIAMASGGTPDHTLYDPDSRSVIVNEFKSGYQAVEEPLDNRQTQSYALAAADHYDADRAFVVILQKGQEPAVERFERLDLEGVREELSGIVNAAHDPGALISPNLVSCQYCDALMGCEAVGDAIANERMAFTGQMPTPDDAGRLADLTLIISKREALATDLARQHLLEDRQVPGFKLGKGRVIRSIDPGDNQAIYKEVGPAMWEHAKAKVGPLLQALDDDGGRMFCERLETRRGAPVFERNGDEPRDMPIHQRPLTESSYQVPTEPDKFGQMIAQSKDDSAWAKEVREVLKDGALDSHAVNGWHVRPGNKQQLGATGDALAEAYETVAGTDREKAFFDALSVSPKVTAAAGDDEQRKRLEDLIVTKASKASVLRVR